MYKNRRASSGVITVFISLLITGVLSLGTLTIEAGRLQAAKAQLQDANISAATSMIASYDSNLFNRYGLLLIDNKMMTTERYLDYIKFNSDSAAGYEGNNLAKMYTVGEVELQGLYNLTYPSVLKRQILSRAKYNVDPQDFTLNNFTMDSYFADLQNKAKYVLEQISLAASGSSAKGSAASVPSDMRSALNSLQNTFKKIKKYDEKYSVLLKDSEVALLPGTTGTIKHSIPKSDTQLINAAVADAKTVIGADGDMLVSKTTEYKEKDVGLSTSYISTVVNTVNVSNITPNAVKLAQESKKLIEGVNAAVNVLNNDRDGNMLLNSYIASFFSNRNNKAEGYIGPTDVKVSDGTAFVTACTEYVFGGNSNETINQQSAYDYIIATRLVHNLYTTISETKRYNSNDATNVAAHILWAYYETLADAELLAKYNAVVPTTKYDMILPVNSPSRVSGAFGSGNFESAMRSLGIIKGTEIVVKGIDSTDYSDALAQALWFVPNSQKLLRVADLIQLEMRYRQKNVEKTSVTFLMRNQNTFCRAKCTVTMNSILPVISLGENNINNHKFYSVKYVGY